MGRVNVRSGGFDFVSVLDIVGAINDQEEYEKSRNYWKYLKAKLRKEQSEVVSDTTQLKLTASDGKKYNTDVISGSPGAGWMRDEGIWKM